MLDALQLALTHRERARIVPVTRLFTLREELEEFKRSESLNGFQQWILDNRYQLRLPSLEFEPRSIIVVAVPHPPYAEVTLEWNGRRYTARSLVMSDFGATARDVRAFLAARGLQMAPASDVPLKRLAVRSGLATYGRNNVTYVAGLGSMFSLDAYYSDLPCDDDSWCDLRTPPECERCVSCLKSCPTGAIRPGRFLIDNERCLSYLNENAGAFPDWLPAGVHHTLYDCLRCQLRCPINIRLHAGPGDPVAFDDRETELLLQAVPFAQMPPATLRKVRYLGLDEWPDGLPRNLRVLFEQADAAAAAG